MSSTVNAGVVEVRATFDAYRTRHGVSPEVAIAET